MRDVWHVGGCVLEMWAKMSADLSCIPRNATLHRCLRFIFELKTQFEHLEDTQALMLIVSQGKSLHSNDSQC